MEESTLPCASTPSAGVVVDGPISPSIQDGSLIVTSQSIRAYLVLEQGMHRFQSEPVRIGTWQGLPLSAILRIDYEYLADEDLLILHGRRDESDAQLSIATFLTDTTRPAGNADLQHACLHRVNDTGINHRSRDLWVRHARGTSAFTQEMAVLSGAFADAVAAAAVRAGVSRVRQLGGAPTVGWDNAELYMGLLHPATACQAPADKVARIRWLQDIVDSTVFGTETWQKNQDFANVQDSSGDPYPPGYKSWYTLWKTLCNGENAARQCSSFNMFDGSDKIKKCTSSLVGGHIIGGQTAGPVEEGQKVYIFPICDTHNNYHNDIYYMTLIDNFTCVVLNYRATLNIGHGPADDSAGNGCAAVA